MRFLAILIATLVPTAAVDNRQPISIHPGETVTLEFRGRTAVVTERGPAPPMSKFEAVILKRMQGQEVPAGSGVQPAVPVFKEDVADVEFPQPTTKRVRLTYRLVPAVRPGAERHSLLFIMNGFSDSFRYRVLMHANDRVTPTDVCEVLPNRSGTEHWPYVIDQLDLTAEWLEPPQDGNVRCE